MPSLARIFNTEVIKERVSSLVQEMTRTEWSRSYSCGSEEEGRNLYLLRRLITDNDYNYTDAVKKDGLVISRAVNYLKNSNTLTRRQCILLYSMIAHKRCCGCLKPSPV